MSNDVEPEDAPFEITRIRQLVRLMKDNDLSEVDLQKADSRIRLKRDKQENAQIPAMDVASMQQAMSMMNMANAAPMQATPVAPVAESSTPVKTEEPKTNFVTVKSPLVGTFYASSSPDSDPFVKEGDQITGDTIVCIVEAMKVFNEIEAKVSGKIVKCLVENGSPVEFNQDLYQVDPG